MNGIKIYVADDHSLFRTALIKLLSTFPRVSNVQGASNGKELLKLVQNEIPDVAIVDWEMPIMDGAKTCERLQQDYPEIKILIVSMYESTHFICNALQSGAHAFLSKGAECDELELAINTLFDKGIYRNKTMLEALRSTSQRKNLALIGPRSLSARELSIIRLLCEGNTVRQISNDLSLSENTIRNHKVRIMRKLKVSNTSALVKYAMENNVLNM